MIRCECPHCAQILEVGDEYAGQVMACPHCGQAITLPSVATTQEAPPVQPPPIPTYTPTPAVAQPDLGPPQSCGLAVASLALGISSYLCMGPFCSVPGVITGHMALSKIAKAPRRLAGHGMAVAGLVLSYINVGIVVLLIVSGMAAAIVLPALARAREAAWRASCQNNLKQFGLVFKMMSGEDKQQRYPELSSEKGHLIFTNRGQGMQPVYPEYLTDLNILFCPSDDEPRPVKDDINKALDTSSYDYLGYVVTNDKELKAFADAYKEHIAKGLPFDGDLDVPPGTGTGGGNKILRLREGVERELCKDPNNPASVAMAQSSIPVMWDRIASNPGGSMTFTLTFNHIPGGCNVLFMDGHVEFIRYPGKFPVTREAARILGELEALRSP